jgi:thiamine pyrophosphate-dependent acetolactate synthase large subunit-like protein
MMHTAEILELFKGHRGDAIVIPGRGGRHWVPINDGPFDLPVGDPAMGGHAGFGLGVALAQPKRKVVLFDSEGDILMSLGMLVTIAEQKPANLIHFILDNGVYATTGGQPVPNADNVDYVAVARGAGYERAYEFSEIEDFKRELPSILNEMGPVFIRLRIHPEIQNEAIGNRRPWMKRTRERIVVDLRNELGLGK